MANDDSTVAEQLDSTRSEILRIQHKIRQNELDHGGVQSEIATFDRQLADTTDLIASNRIKLQQQARIIKKLAGQQNQLSATLGQQTERLTRLVQIKFHQGNSAPIKMLLNRQNPTGLGRHLRWYRYLNTAIAQQRSLLKAELQELVQMRDAVKLKRHEHHLAELRQIKQKDALKLLKQDRLQLIAKLDSELNQSNARLSNLKKNQARLSALLSQIQRSVYKPAELDNNPSFISHKGRLASPIFAPIRHSFGQSRGDADAQWQGVMFDARAGKPIKAIADGRVVFAEWLRGYGLLLILDHGAGYMSLYGHTQVLHKQAGEAVKRGQILGLVGSSGGLRQASLYFEIRHNGNPENPKLWCRMPS